MTRGPCCGKRSRHKVLAATGPAKEERHAEGLLGRDLSFGEKSEAWKAYAKLAVPAIERAGGRFLARSNPTKVYESGMNERVVLVEFDSIDNAVACHDTPAYKEALKALGTGNVERDMRVVEGAA
jgi:uncharacterized protein (DUF1330 family)